MKFDLTNDLTPSEISRFESLCHSRKVTTAAMVANLVILETRKVARRKPKTAATV